MHRPAGKRDAPTPDAAERELIARVRAGDVAAFETLFVTHYEGMCALAFMLVRSRDAAEDVVANVFRNLWARRAGWEPHGAARTYLLTATRNEALNLLRSLRRERGFAERLAREEVVPALGSAAAPPDDAAVARDHTAAIEQAAETLPARAREVFLLRWREGLKYPEIAERLGIALKTVEMHMTRALRSIRERLHESD
jgi:RNA polymerase sigma-70 factor (ECF subfamily)